MAILKAKFSLKFISIGENCRTYFVNLREKFSPGPGFKPGSPAQIFINNSLLCVVKIKIPN